MCSVLQSVCLLLKLLYHARCINLVSCVVGPGSLAVWRFTASVTVPASATRAGRSSASLFPPLVSFGLIAAT